MLDLSYTHRIDHKSYQRMGAKCARLVEGDYAIISIQGYIGMAYYGKDSLWYSPYIICKREQYDCFKKFCEEVTDGIFLFENVAYGQGLSEENYLDEINVSIDISTQGESYVLTMSVGV
jgi:hypothetical protein